MLGPCDFFFPDEFLTTLSGLGVISGLFLFDWLVSSGIHSFLLGGSVDLPLIIQDSCPTGASMFIISWGSSGSNPNSSKISLTFRELPYLILDLASSLSTLLLLLRMASARACDRLWGFSLLRVFLSDFVKKAESLVGWDICQRSASNFLCICQIAFSQPAAKASIIDGGTAISMSWLLSS